MNIDTHSFAHVDRLEQLKELESLKLVDSVLSELDAAVLEINKSFSGSWLGYHAYVYYDGLNRPPPGAHFSQEWGLKDLSITSLGTYGDWREYNPDRVQAIVRAQAGDPDMERILNMENKVLEVFLDVKSELDSLLSTYLEATQDSYISRLHKELNTLRPLTPQEIAHSMRPTGQVMTRDTTALGQSWRTPPHITVGSEVAAIRNTLSICKLLTVLAKKAGAHIARQNKVTVGQENLGTNVFIGHGRSSAWRELKDFVQDRLELPVDEFNRVPVAGITNQARLKEMLDSAAVALVIMTAEDENADGNTQARMNVIHEVGLFQGRIGFTRAIVLLEDGCTEFSNIEGLGQIRFPEGNISACFEEIRRVLEREKLI